MEQPTVGVVRLQVVPEKADGHRRGSLCMSRRRPVAACAEIIEVLVSSRRAGTLGHGAYAEALQTSLILFREKREGVPVEGGARSLSAG